MGQRRLLVIGYYTLGSAYADEAARLARSLDEVRMAHRIVGVPPVSSSWHDGVALKAGVVRAALCSVRVPVLYIDVDAHVHVDCTEYFESLCADHDFAAHWFHGPGAGGREQGNAEYHMLSGTLWFNQTLAAHALLDAWMRLNTLLARCGDRKGRGQRNLAFVVQEPARYGALPLRVKKLPGRYCYVYRRPECYPPEERRAVVIEHLLASRENRDESAGRVDADRRERIAELEGK